MPEGHMRHKSAYVIAFQHFFLPDLFFQKRQNLRPAFHCLLSRNCLADLVYSGHTDFNLNDGRFWLNFGVGPFDQEVENRRPAFAFQVDDPDVDRYHEFRHKIWGMRTASDLIKEGASVPQLFKRVFPDGVITAAPVVPYLGPLRLLRNAIPCCPRSTTHEVLASLFEADIPSRRDSYASSVFGYHASDQSLSHLPLSVGSGNVVHIREGPAGNLGQIHFPESTAYISGKLRVQVYPYGLATSFLVLSLTSTDGLSSDDLILFKRSIFERVGESSLPVTYAVGKQVFGTARELHTWVRDRIHRAITINRVENVPRASNLHSVVCLNAPATGRMTRAIWSEMIGIAARDSRWRELSKEFLVSHSSAFGKYAGDYAIPSADTLLLSFGARWRNYPKRKSRVRFHWGMLNIFDFVLARKFLVEGFLIEVAALSKGGPEAETTSALHRIQAWLDNIKIQHKGLHPSRRRLYHRLRESYRIDAPEDALSRSLNEFLSVVGLPARMVQAIHFEDFDGRRFERLVFAFHLRTENWSSLEWLGEGGGDSGRDIWGVRGSMRRRVEAVCIQCSNRKTTLLKKATDDIDKIVGQEGPKPDTFRIVCGGPVSAAWRKKLTEYAKSKGIRRCEIWSGIEFEERLRANCEELLLRFVNGVPFPDHPRELEAFASRRHG